MIILSEKLVSLIYCYDTLIDQIVFVWMNIYELICIFLFVADWGLSGNMNVSISSHVEILHFLSVAIICEI